MDQPTKPNNAMKSVVPNHLVGLNSDHIDEMNVNHAVFTYIANKKEAPVPKATVGPCDSMRKRILQLSLGPSVVKQRRLVADPGNVVMKN